MRHTYHIAIESNRINKLTREANLTEWVCVWVWVRNETQIIANAKISRPWNLPELMRTTHNVASSTTIPNERPTIFWLQLASRRAEAPNRDALEYCVRNIFRTQSFHCRMCVVCGTSRTQISQKSLNEQMYSWLRLRILSTHTLNAHHNNHHYHITLIFGCWNFSQNCPLY